MRQRGSGEAHSFDRRMSDVNFEALSTRMGTIETRVEVLEGESKATTRELRANTELTKQVHEAMFGRGDDDDGMQGKLKDVHDMFLAVQGGFKLIETAGKIAKPMLYILALGAAVWALVTTGNWKWPA